MGASASVQQEKRTKETSVNAHHLRERLRNQYGVEEEDLGHGNDPSGIRMSEVPALLKAKGVFMKNLKSKRQSKADNNNIVKKQDNHALLKEIFHRIDPAGSLDSSSGKVVGEIEISLKYKSNESTLLVKIGRAKNLENVDARKLPNPFVQVDLFTKRVDAVTQTQKTRQKSNTANPQFQEILIFSLEQKDLVEAKLKVCVWNKDAIVQDDFLGEIILELYREEVNGGVAAWHKLNPQVDLDISGRIEISLKYEDSKLIVFLHQATELKTANDILQTSNPFVRCYVTGVSKRAETKVVEEDLNPVFEENFAFELEGESLENGVLVLNVRSKEAVGKDKRLGDVHIPLNGFNFNQPNRVWYSLADLRNTPDARGKWSEDGLSQEFKEAMRAHAIYRYPECLFKGKHQGRKLVAVSCSKARSSAKMMLVNGFPVKE